MPDTSPDLIKDILLQAHAFISHNLTPYLYNILAALILFLLGRWGVRLLSSWLTRALQHHVEPTAARFVANILKILLYIFVVIAALSQLGVRTTSLVAILGAASLAVGLSLKDSLGNFAAGVLLVSLRPFRTGDYIETNAVQGVVQEIKIFATSLLTSDNRVIIIPNSAIINSFIVNHYAMPTRRVDLVIRIAYSADLGKVKTDLLKIMAAEPRILKDPAPSVSVATLADTGVDLNVRSWVKSSDYSNVGSDLTEQFKLHFSSLGLHTPAQKLEVFMATRSPASNDSP